MHILPEKTLSVESSSPSRPRVEIRARLNGLKDVATKYRSDVAKSQMEGAKRPLLC